MSKEFVSFLIAFTFPLFIFGQSTAVNDCSKVKYGTFYFYPENVQNGFTIIRERNIQKEINLTTSDTTFWEVKWKNACEFNLKFIRKSRPISNDEKAFYNSHISVVKILKATKEYYVFNAGLDSLNSTNALTDTLWLKARVN
jgi:hypothetical protein